MAVKIREEYTHKCLLCGKTFFGYGNNPEPLVKSEDIESGKEIICCDDCNLHKVIPARLKF